MKRTEKLLKMVDHPVLGNLFVKLTSTEYDILADFVKENEHLTDDEYAFKCNRWFLDDPFKPKNHINMQSIAIQCK